MDTVTGICDAERPFGPAWTLVMLIGTTESHLSRVSFESDKNVRPDQWSTPVIQAFLKVRKEDLSISVSRPVWVTV